MLATRAGFVWISERKRHLRVLAAMAVTRAGLAGRGCAHRASRPRRRGVAAPMAAAVLAAAAIALAGCTSAAPHTHGLRRARLAYPPG
jgi:hypothetical protein